MIMINYQNKSGFIIVYQPVVSSRPKTISFEAWRPIKINTVGGVRQSLKGCHPTHRPIETAELPRASPVVGWLQRQPMMAALAIFMVWCVLFHAVCIAIRRICSLGDESLTLDRHLCISKTSRSSSKYRLPSKRVLNTCCDQS